MKRSPLQRKTALRPRTRIRPKARKPKKGVVRDPEYREFVLRQQSVVPYAFGLLTLREMSPEAVLDSIPLSCVEGHHVGYPKNDRRMVPLYWWLHRETKISVHGGGGNRKFEARFGVDLEAEIEKLNARFEAERGNK